MIKQKLTITKMISITRISLLGTRRRLACGRIPAATAACLFTNKVKQKSEVSFRSAKVNP